MKRRTMEQQARRDDVWTYAGLGVVLLFFGLLALSGLRRMGR